MPDMTPQERRADRIKRLRVALRLTKGRCRRRLGGTSWQLWNRLEDPSANPTEKNLIAAARVLHVRIEDLYR